MASMATAWRNFEHINLISLESQTNIYGSAVLSLDRNINKKVLIASLDGPVTCVKYDKTRGNQLKCICDEMPLPSTVSSSMFEVVAIDSFNKYNAQNQVVITLVLMPGSVEMEDIDINTPEKIRPLQPLLAIYVAHSDKSSDLKMEELASTGQKLGLSFTPLHLNHICICRDGVKEIAILLSDVNKAVHVFVKDPNGDFDKSTLAAQLPEFQNLQDDVLWIDSQHTSQRRYTAVGGQDGYVKFTISNLQTNQQIQSWTVEHQGAISSVRLFTFESEAYCGSKIKSSLQDYSNKSQNNEESCRYSLLVACSTDVSVVYEDVCSEGFNLPLVLPGSNEYDCILCSYIADIDWDGKNEIILGSYGQELLVYKRLDNYFNLSKDDTDETLMEKARSPYKSLDLIYQHSFSEPIYSCCYIDLTGDGVCELVVTTFRALHVLQHNLESVSQKCSERTALLLEGRIDWDI
ncbi:Kaptin [Trichoplax sp. H2]|nr:Kaptin [Trichoplax sp. H2]|eukprot:RDD44297.1 Kaptin [Trichoplax sp. H2]